MKTLIACICFACSTTFVHPQSASPVDSTPAKCDWNLQDRIFEQIMHIPELISYAKNPFPQECLDVSYKRDKRNGACDPADNCINTPAFLKYDVYYPLHDYTLQKLPAVILFHGGGFRECPDYAQKEIEMLCMEFAKRGFVAFNVEYRRGTIKDLRNLYYQSVQDMLAGYRGLQDGRGAIKSIIKRQRLHDTEFWSDPYQIDTNNIFTGGFSAGGFISLINSWYTNQMIYQVYPSEPGYVTINEALGPLDADYYYGEPGIDYKPLIKGIISLWGGTPVPVHYSSKQGDYFLKDNNLSPKPVIAFQGVLDSVFPYYMNASQLITFSYPPKTGGPDYNTESSCLLKAPYALGTDTVPDMIMASALNYYAYAKKYAPSMPMELYSDCQMGHGLDESDGPGFQSDFGTGFNNSASVIAYIGARAATFFQAIMNGKSAGDIGPPSRFTECENTRIKCGPPDKPNNCSNYHICSP